MSDSENLRCCSSGEEHPISKAGVPQLRFHLEVSCYFLRDLDAVIRVDVYFGSAEGKGTGFSSELQDMLLGPVVVDPRDERARRVVLFLAGDGESVSPVHGWRSEEGICTECLLQKYLHECGWLTALNFLW